MFQPSDKYRIAAIKACENCYSACRSVTDDFLINKNGKLIECDTLASSHLSSRVSDLQGFYMRVKSGALCTTKELEKMGSCLKILTVLAYYVDTNKEATKLQKNAVIDLCDRLIQGKMGEGMEIEYPKNINKIINNFYNEVCNLGEQKEFAGIKFEAQIKDLLLGNSPPLYHPDPTP